MGKVESFYESLFRKIGAEVLHKEVSSGSIHLEVNYESIPFEVITHERNENQLILRMNISFDGKGGYDPTMMQILLKTSNEVNHERFGTKAFVLEPLGFGDRYIYTVLLNIEATFARLADVEIIFDSFLKQLVEAYQTFGSKMQLSG